MRKTKLLRHAYFLFVLSLLECSMSPQKNIWSYNEWKASLPVTKLNHKKATLYQSYQNLNIDNSKLYNLLLAKVFSGIYHPLDNHSITADSEALPERDTISKNINWNQFNTGINNTHDSKTNEKQRTNVSYLTKQITLPQLAERRQHVSSPSLLNLVPDHDKGTQHDKKVKHAPSLISFDPFWKQWNGSLSKQVSLRKNKIDHDLLNDLEPQKSLAETKHVTSLDQPYNTVTKDPLYLTFDRNADAHFPPISLTSRKMSENDVLSDMYSSTSENIMSSNLITEPVDVDVIPDGNGGMTIQMPTNIEEQTQRKDFGDSTRKSVLSQRTYKFGENEFTDIGCFADKWIRAIPVLDGNHPLLMDSDYKSRKGALQKCARASFEKRFVVFALQNGGQCFAGSNSENKYDVYGKSDKCKDDGLGGSWANQVYVFHNGKLFPFDKNMPSTLKDKLSYLDEKIKKMKTVIEEGEDSEVKENNAKNSKSTKVAKFPHRKLKTIKNETKSKSDTEKLTDDKEEKLNASKYRTVNKIVDKNLVESISKTKQNLKNLNSSVDGNIIPSNHTKIKYDESTYRDISEGGDLTLERIKAFIKEETKKKVFKDDKIIININPMVDKKKHIPIKKGRKKMKDMPNDMLSLETDLRKHGVQKVLNKIRAKPEIEMGKDTVKICEEEKDMSSNEWISKRRVKDFAAHTNKVKSCESAKEDLQSKEKLLMNDHLAGSYNESYKPETRTTGGIHIVGLQGLSKEILEYKKNTEKIKQLNTGEIDVLKSEHNFPTQNYINDSSNIKENSNKLTPDVKHSKNGNTDRSDSIHSYNFLFDDKDHNSIKNARKSEKIMSRYLFGKEEKKKKEEKSQKGTKNEKAAAINNKKEKGELLMDTTENNDNDKKVGDSADNGLYLEKSSKSRSGHDRMQHVAQPSCTCPKKVCSSRLNLAFVIDVSMLAELQGIEKMTKIMEFGRYIASAFTFSPAESRLALITFATDAQIMINFNLYLGPDILLEARNSVRVKPKTNRYAGQALALAKEGLFDRGHRSDALDVVILITDGPSKDDATLPSRALRDMGVTIICVGLESDLDLKQLEDIASDPDESHLFLTDYTTIWSLVHRVQKAACVGGDLHNPETPCNCDDPDLADQHLS